MGKLTFLRRLVVDLPRQARLAYCLVRDPRVPLATRAAFGAGLGVIVTPFIDLPASLPVVGELDVLALSLLATRLFVAACPDEVVADIERQIEEGRSVFDADLQRGERVARWIASRFQHDQPPVWQDGAEGSAAEAGAPIPDPPVPPAVEVRS
ncbi:MAG: YkvA family protein [Candidatus Dormibacteria bacterium]